MPVWRCFAPDLARFEAVEIGMMQTGDGQAGGSVAPHCHQPFRNPHIGGGRSVAARCPFERGRVLDENATNHIRRSRKGSGR